MEELMKFFTQQDVEWKQHRKQIGFFGRLYENLFGSKFVGYQIREYRKFCIDHDIKYYIV